MIDLPTYVPYADLVALADSRILAMTKLMAPLWSADGIDKAKARVLATLSATCISTSGSALILLETGKVWDAAVLQRGVMEGTIRFLYLLHGDDSLDERFEEFTVTLEDIASLRLHRKAEVFLEATKNNQLDSGSQKTLEGLLLSESELQKITGAHSKRERRIINDRWSFVKLLNYLVAKNVLPADAAEDFQLRYLKSSQSIHGNPLGLASFYERTHRIEPNNTWANYAHAAEIAKMLRDLCLYRLYAVYTIVKKDMRELLEAYEDVQFDDLCASIFETHHNLEYPDKK